MTVCFVMLPPVSGAAANAGESFHLYPFENILHADFYSQVSDGSSDGCFAEKDARAAHAVSILIVLASVEKNP